jgi:hypothetical protein
MKSNSNIFKNIKNRLNKKDDIYKYDDIIDKKLGLLKKKNNSFQISNFNSNRKIPNKEELKKKYDNFIKKIHNIQIKENKNSVFSYKNKIDYLCLKNDKQYLFFNLNLQTSKIYKLSIKFVLKEESTINFVFNNNINKQIYSSKQDIKGEIIFNTNNLITLDNYLELYVIFKPTNIINIHNLMIHIQEINNKNNDITLLKNNNKITIY